MSAKFEMPTIVEETEPEELPAKRPCPIVEEKLPALLKDLVLYDGETEIGGFPDGRPDLTTTTVLSTADREHIDRYAALFFKDGPVDTQKIKDEIEQWNVRAHDTDRTCVKDARLLPAAGHGL
jgi:hypothetical protein